MHSGEPLGGGARGGCWRVLFVRLFVFLTSLCLCVLWEFFANQNDQNTYTLVLFP